MRNPFLLVVFVSALLGTSLPPAHAARTWHVQDGVVTLAIEPSHLATLGLSVVGERATGDAGSAATRLPGTLQSFDAEPGDVSFTSEGGAFRSLASGTMTIPVRGGLILAGRDPSTGASTAPIFLYDFELEVDPARGPDAVVLRSRDAAIPAPLDVRNAGLAFHEDEGTLGIYFADVVVSEAWAVALGRPHLAGQWLGTLETVLAASTTDAVDRRERLDPSDEAPAAPKDLLLAELYDIQVQGRIGTYPNGLNGLSAATTSCNAGGNTIPWNAPMAETHPFIGLAMFRQKDGVLEMIGKNWIKHGFFALSSNQCGFGCSGSDGSYMGIGCSDTYSAGNNGSRTYLGPRAEVNPYLGSWEACGSFFDEPTSPDPDCNRNYNGNEPNNVNHRLEVEDVDLGVSGAQYYYEGVYYLDGEGTPIDNIGWRTCSTSWNGSSWNVSTTGGGLAPNHGLLVETWGDESHRKNVAVDDGEIVLAVDVTDLGGGMWHYEYAMYNWRSDRGVYSFSVPTGGLPVSNVGFGDIDHDAGNDWTVSTAGGAVTWSTDDWATDPDANALVYQTLFNFRFDAPSAPVAGQAQGGIFKPGSGTTFFVDTQLPDGSAVAVAELGAALSSLALRAVEPNPFASSTRVAFSLPRRGATRLSVVDVTGRTVRVLLEDEAPAGAHDVTWDGRDASGRPVASGVYLLRLESEDGVRTAKVARLR